MKHILSILLLILPLMVSAKKSAFIVGKIPENQRSVVQNKHISDISASYGDVFEDRDLFFRTNLSDNLNFCLEVPLNFDKQVVKFNIAGMIEYNVFVSAGDTTFMEIDLNNANYIQSAFYDHEFVKFSGKNADINTALASKMFNGFLPALYFWNYKMAKKNEFPQNVAFYNHRKNEVKDLINTYFQRIDSTNYSQETKTFLRTELNVRAAHYFSCLLRNIRKYYRAYQNYKKVPIEKYRLEINDETLSFINDFNFCNSETKSASQFYETIKLIKYEFENPLPTENCVNPKEFFASNEIIYKVFDQQNNKQLQSANVKVNYLTIKSTSEKEIWNEIFEPRKGKVVIVDFWYTKCGGCLEIQKEMGKITNELLSKGVEFVYITPQNRSPEKEYYKHTANLCGDSYYLTAEQFVPLYKKFKINTWPTLMILDKNGKISFKHWGYKGNDYFKHKVEEALKK